MPTPSQSYSTTGIHRPAGESGGDSQYFGSGTLLQMDAGSTGTFNGTSNFNGATTGLRDSYEAEAGATRTMTSAESGKVLVCTASSGTTVITLPASVAGLRYTFIAGNAGGEISISPAAADKIMGKGITAADDKDYTNTGGTNAVGDLVTIVGDGVDGWWVVAERGTWARET